MVNRHRKNSDYAGKLRSWTIQRNHELTMTTSNTPGNKYKSANKVYCKAGHSAFLVMDNSSQVGRFTFSKLRNVIVVR
jgi:hypothetical protein